MGACIGTCVLKFIKIVINLFFYLILEVFVFGAVVATSVLLTYWTTRGILSILQYPATTTNILDIIRTWLICWLIGVFTLRWVKSWSSLLTPKRLQKFQDHHYVLCAWLRTIIISFLMVIGTCLQVCTYFFKFYVKIGNQQVVDWEQLMYENDLKFIGSLGLLVYLFARTFRYYRDINQFQVATEVGVDAVKCEKWNLYLEHYYGLLGYELFLTDLVVLILLGVGVISQTDNKLNSWYPYLAGCVIATGVGIILGDVEERMPYLDNRMDKDHPYYRMVHWDVRLHILVFFFLPLLSLGYFYFETVDDLSRKAELLHNLLHLAFIGVIWMSIAKGNTLFAYILRGHFWSVESRIPRDRRGPRNQRYCVSSTGNIRHMINNRIAPQQDSRCGPSPGNCEDICGRLRFGQGQLCQNVKGPTKPAVTTALKNILFDYFPVNVTIRKEEMVAGADQESVSTGTCSSLLNREIKNESGITIPSSVESQQETGGLVLEQQRDWRLIPQLDTSVRPEPKVYYPRSENVEQDEPIEELDDEICLGLEIVVHSKDTLSSCESTSSGDDKKDNSVGSKVEMMDDKNENKQE